MVVRAQGEEFFTRKEVDIVGGIDGLWNAVYLVGHCLKDALVNQPEMEATR